MLKYTLCLLTLNEIEGCKLSVPLINKDSFDDIYALDGGSRDGTIRYLQQLGIKVFVQRENGYNAAYLEAFDHCKTDVLILFHPKGTISPEYASKFKDFFEKGYDLVVASRIIKGASNEEDGHFFKYRKWFVMLLSYLSSVLWCREGYRVRDVLHGFRGMRVQAFKIMKPLDKGLSIDLEMVVRSYKLRLKRAEFSVIEIERPHGSTKFKAYPTGMKLLRYMWYELFRKN
jgi:glycosyltransferase involved in cell wall biosynthesis